MAAQQDETGTRALWLHVEFAALALEVVTRALPVEKHGTEASLRGPVIVIEGEGARAEVVARNRAAARAGIHRGMALEHAWALAGNLVVARRNLETEGQALEETAAWAMQFSSVVTVQAPFGVGLEIGRSLGLYGGFESLRAAFLRGVSELGFSAEIGIAPSPAGARLLARQGQGAAALDYLTLHEALDELPIAFLASELPHSHIDALRQLGLSTLGECWRLPRAALNRRVGDVVVFFDRVFGRRPDPQLPFEPPRCYRRELTLPAAVSDVQALLFGLNRLLLSLVGALQAQALGAVTVRLVLRYEAVLPEAQVWLRLLGPSRDPEHLLGLMRERLEHIALAGAVQVMEITVTETGSMGPAGRDLFGVTKEDEESAVNVLVERLRARLGDEAVRGLDTCADHRPERAWATVVPRSARPDSSAWPGPDSSAWPGPMDSERSQASSGKFEAERFGRGAWGWAFAERGAGEECSSKELMVESGAVFEGDSAEQVGARDAALRPAWLLPVPLALDVVQGCPVYNGRLELLGQGERIEGGWWDGVDVSRDYFRARNPRGECLWVFEDRRRPGTWYLHGVFA